MQSNAMHVKLGHFSDDSAYLILPDELAEAEHIDATIFHGEENVLQVRCKVKSFHPGKIKYIVLPTTEDITWQKKEHAVVGITGSTNLEVVRSAKNFAPVHIGPGDLE